MPCFSLFHNKILLLNTHFHNSNIVLLITVKNCISDFELILLREFTISSRWISTPILYDEKTIIRKKIRVGCFLIHLVYLYIVTVLNSNISTFYLNKRKSSVRKISLTCTKLIDR